jgi:hypothetical protein
MLPLLLALALGQVALSQDSEMSPIRKVVTLIEEMKATVEKEAKDDQTAYDKYACWCKTNDQEKSASIAEAESKIDSLSAFIEEAAAKEGELKTEIGQLEQDIAEDTTALKTASANREEEHQSFLAEEADFKETRGLLEEAVAVLSKVNLLQKQGKKASPALMAQAKTAAALLQVRDSIQQRHPEFQSVMQKDLFEVMGSLEEEAPRSLRKGTALAQSKLLPWETTAEEDGAAAKPNALEGAAAGAKSYNARSGGILGLLKEMQDEFSRDLAKSQHEDMEAEIAFQKLKAAKEGEIDSATKQRNDKETQLADLSDRKAKAKEDKETTEAALTADQKFLMNLKKDCKSEDEEYQIRVKARGEELVALSETLKILTDDESRELFGKTISLVQLSAVHQSVSSAQLAAMQDRALERAMHRIAMVAKKNKNWMLATLAVRVRLDAFSKVKEVMDKMLVELEKQQKEEIAKMEQCNTDFDTTEDSIKVAENTKDDLGEKHLGLSNLIETLTKEIADAQKEESEMEISLKQAGEARKAQSKEFQTSVMDQRATINILSKAQARLTAYYNTKAGAFLQQPQKPSFNSYEKSGGAGGVLQLLQKVITEAEIAEKEIVTSNQKAQSDYAEFVQDTSDSIQATRDAISEKQGQLAQADSEKSETQGGQLSNEEELAKLSDLLKAHHLDCDYVVKYFDMRQTARQEEMDSIKDAKAILSGADFGK